MAAEQTDSTADEWYTDRLKYADVDWTLARRLHHRIYRKHIRGLVAGRVLDVGCGVGGNMVFLSASSVGVDHNPTSVEAAREQGFTAYVPDELHARADEFEGSFDTILLAHVVEHMDEAAGHALLKEYLPYLRPNGRIVFITPQEAGYATDPTHVRFVDFDGSRQLAETVGMTVTRKFSFMFPRMFGKYRVGNEFCVVAERKAG